MTGLNASARASGHQLDAPEEHADRRQASRPIRVPDGTSTASSAVLQRLGPLCAPHWPKFCESTATARSTSGKAHFGALDAPGAPRNLGFDVNIAGHAAGGPAALSASRASPRLRSGDRVWDVPCLEAYHSTGTFLTEALDVEALKQLDPRPRRRRALLPLHVALRGARPLRCRTRGSSSATATPASTRPRRCTPHSSRAWTRASGDLRAGFDRHGAASNTVVMFMSDNGGPSRPRAGRPGRTPTTPRSAAARARLGEGGIREPMIVRWPAHRPRGSACGQPVSSRTLPHHFGNGQHRSRIRRAHSAH